MKRRNPPRSTLNEEHAPPRKRRAAKPDNTDQDASVAIALPAEDEAEPVAHVVGEPMQVTEEEEIATLGIEEARKLFPQLPWLAHVVSNLRSPIDSELLITAHEFHARLQELVDALNGMISDVAALTSPLEYLNKTLNDATHDDNGFLVSTTMTLLQSALELVKQFENTLSQIATVMGYDLGDGTRPQRGYSAAKLSILPEFSKQLVNLRESAANNCREFLHSIDNFLFHLPEHAHAIWIDGVARSQFPTINGVEPSQ